LTSAELEALLQKENLQVTLIILQRALLWGSTVCVRKITWGWGKSKEGIFLDLIGISAWKNIAPLSSLSVRI